MLDMRGKVEEWPYPEPLQSDPVLIFDEVKPLGSKKMLIKDTLVDTLGQSHQGDGASETFLSEVRYLRLV